MPFTLFYRGPLRSNGGPKDKHEIRRNIHPQLKRLWTQEPLLGYTKRSNNLIASPPEPGNLSVIYRIGHFNCACLVTERLFLHTEVDITFLRPGLPGSLIKSGGDIDNRLKTLFDGLRRPLDESELPKGALPTSDEDPFHCLLADDALISKVTVTIDQLLTPIPDDEVVLIIRVGVIRSRTVIKNASYIT
jgi:hypothetical protein